MFEYLLQLTTSHGLSNWIKGITTPNYEGGTSIQTAFSYDEETETIKVEGEGYYVGNYRQYSSTFTVDEKLKKILTFDITQSLNVVKLSLKEITGDKKLHLFVDDVVGLLNKAVNNYNNNKPVRERPVIKEQLLRAIKEVQEIFGSQFDLKFESLKQDVGKVGNPNFRANESDIDIHRVVEVANRYIEEGPETYAPYRKGSFLSSNLRDQLADEFNVSPSTMREHLKRKCEKVDQLFKVKVGY